MGGWARAQVWLRRWARFLRLMWVLMQVVSQNGYGRVVRGARASLRAAQSWVRRKEQLYPKHIRSDHVWAPDFGLRFNHALRSDHVRFSGFAKSATPQRVLERPFAYTYFWLRFWCLPKMRQRCSILGALRPATDPLSLVHGRVSLATSLPPFGICSATRLHPPLRMRPFRRRQLSSNASHNGVHSAAFSAAAPGAECRLAAAVLAGLRSQGTCRKPQLNRGTMEASAMARCCKPRQLPV